MNSSITVGGRHLYTVAEFVSLPEFNYLTASSLRHLIFKSQSRYSSTGEFISGNGLVESGAIVRVGRKILVSAPEFREWIRGQRKTPANQYGN